MADLKKYGSAAATGAAAGGAVGGPWGAAIGGGGAVLLTALDDLFGGGGPSTDEAYAEKIRRMEQGAHTYEQYRPQVQQAREQALQQQLSAYNGANNAMGLMYGPQYDPRNYAPNLGVNPYAHGFAPTSYGSGQSPGKLSLVPPTPTTIDANGNSWMPTADGKFINPATGEARTSPSGHVQTTDGSYHSEVGGSTWKPNGDGSFRNDETGQMMPGAPPGSAPQKSAQQEYWDQGRAAAKAAGWWKPNYDASGNIVSWTNSATGETRSKPPGVGG